MTGIHMSLLGSVGGGDVVQLTDQLLTDSEIDQPTSVSYQINSNGKAYGTVGDVLEELESWVVPNGNAGNYEVRATLSSGDALSSGTLNTWQACSTTRTWNISSTAFTNKTTILLIELRPTGGSVVDSATIEMSLTYN